jgi:ADP-ribose pyrophosphatase YjhB (NUDIX family)
MLIELPTAEEIDGLAITTPRLEVRKIELDFGKARANLDYAPCKGQVVVVVRGEDGILLVRGHGAQGWSLPTDRIASGEDIGKSAKRVARVQCGLMLRSAELAGVYDVVWHYSDISIKRLHFVYAALTDDRKCAPVKGKEISEARFFREVPDAVRENEVYRFALADCNAK